MSAVDAILPYQPREIVLDLPFPPSQNTIWRRGKQGMYISPAYRAWKRNADAFMMTHRIRRSPMIEVPFEATILLNADAGIGDGDNRIKVVLDYAQRIELIKNDSLCRKGNWEWVPASQAPYGARLIIKEIA